MVVGHNIQSFDLPIFRNQARQKEIEVPSWISYDTLDLSQRFIESPGYSLTTLTATLKLDHKPTHQAMDDVRCTVDLLQSLIPRARQHSDIRRNLILKYASVFEPVYQMVNEWRKHATQLRPHELLSHVLTDSGLEEMFKNQPKRLSNLETLKLFFQERDRSELSPDSALMELIKLAALSKNIDFLSETDNRIPIITVHQSKGLEFDYVFIAGASEGEFPNYYAVRDGRVEEEKRLFYVAVTRAKQRLLISSHARNQRGFNCRPSRFISQLGKGNLMRAE